MRTIKKIIAYPFTYLLYYIGDCVSGSKTFESGRSYDFYNWCMTASLLIQEWGDLKEPWGKPVEHDKNDDDETINNQHA